MKRSVVILTNLVVLLLGHVLPASAADKPVPADYAKQIKPLLIARCADCHGADEQESGLRVDAAVLTIRGGDRGPSVVPGKADESLLYQAIAGIGDVSPMPEGEDKLSKAEIALIRRWINEGAKHPADEKIEPASVSTDHWAFQPVKRFPLPSVNDTQWGRNPVDRFILAVLEEKGLAPSPEAAPVTLIRRLSLDLRGIPPTLTEVETFVSDKQPGAYERLVDRMLSSPNFGERWGRHWLDVARYADSNGFTIDSARSIWKYRDWVIEAFNRDMPFDQFTIEQLAGDLLPDATTEQVVATGFHRNTLVNEEGGTDDEQFRVESVVDRVNTTGAVFLGLSVGCAQCHEHKFDPITQREYYEMFAIFNNCDEPQISVPSPVQSAQLERLRAELADVRKKLNARDAEFLRGMSEWEKRLASMAPPEWTSLDPIEVKTEKGSVLTKLDDRSFVTDFSIPANDTFVLTFDQLPKNVTAIRLEALTHASLPENGPGRAKNGNFVLSEVEVLATPAAADNSSAKPTRVAISKAIADHSQVGFSVTNAVDNNQKTGWAINVEKGSLNVDREATFILGSPISGGKITRLTIKLHQNHGDAGYLLGRFRLSAGTASPEQLETPASIRSLIATPAAKRTKPQKAQLAAAFKQTDSIRKPLAVKLGSLKREEDQLLKAVPKTLVMRNRKEPRESHIHIRGDFLRKGARVTGGTPAVMPSLPGDVTIPSRLDLANWLVDAEHPLTSRVTVNRFWQHLFGSGLVSTENDFGTQGSLPTHPELLDWLSTEFVRQGWSIKQLTRLLVSSATYRQSSQAREELLTDDPRNDLLARQSRLRLEAESIRDVSLAASGLLFHRIGGPGVYPPQPAGIYVLTQVKKAWPEESGLQRFRRGMYTYFWRSSPYPFLPTFDAPNANTTCTRRTRSNTPLQALTLANDRAFYEIAQGLAARIIDEGPDDTAERIRFAFQVCFSRQPTPEEFERLHAFFEQQQQFFAADESRAKAVTASRDWGETTATQAAAWTALARVMLNLDEFITRE